MFENRFCIKQTIRVFRVQWAEPIDSLWCIYPCVKCVTIDSGNSLAVSLAAGQHWPIFNRIKKLLWKHAFKNGVKMLGISGRLQFDLSSFCKYVTPSFYSELSECMCTQMLTTYILPSACLRCRGRAGTVNREAKGTTANISKLSKDESQYCMHSKYNTSNVVKHSYKFWSPLFWP